MGLRICNLPSCYPFLAFVFGLLYPSELKQHDRSKRRETLIQESNFISKNICIFKVIEFLNFKKGNLLENSWYSYLITTPCPCSVGCVNTSNIIGRHVIMRLIGVMLVAFHGRNEENQKPLKITSVHPWNLSRFFHNTCLTPLPLSVTILSYCSTLTCV
jgi:hypothetical protein